MFYNEEGKEKKTIENRKIDFLRFSNPQAFFQYDKCQYMYFAMNDTIYQVVGNDLTPKYFVDFGSSSIEYSKFENRDMLDDYLMNGTYLTMSFFSESSKYYFVKVNDRDYTYSVVVTKSNGRLVYGNVINYNGFPIYDPVGYTSAGPILLFGPPTVPIYQNIVDNGSRFIPKGFLELEVNANPGIVILKEK
jgi:hypothetical protein